MFRQSVSIFSVQFLQSSFVIAVEVEASVEMILFERNWWLVVAELFLGIMAHNICFDNLVN